MRESSGSREKNGGLREQFSTKSSQISPLSLICSLSVGHSLREIIVSSCFIFARSRVSLSKALSTLEIQHDSFGHAGYRLSLCETGCCNVVLVGFIYEVMNIYYLVGLEEFCKLLTPKCGNTYICQSCKK